MSIRYILLFLMGFAFTTYDLSAETPVEGVVNKYDDVKGAKDFIAQGGARLSIAKSILKKTPVASLSPDVDEVMVLKMGNTSEQDKTSFLKDLDNALKTYENHGRHPSENGPVDVYVKRNSAGHIIELVIYNPELYNLNVLHGNFPVDALLKIQ